MSINSKSSTGVENFDPKHVASSDADCTLAQQGRSDHWEVRTQEQSYAFLPNEALTEKDLAIENRYGKRIDLLEVTDTTQSSTKTLPKNRSMFINENPAVGSNPNRNKQHGFYFTADNCIGCHACEAACSEKNDNPAHLAFRSVGYVEGGSYPDYKRMNISMACNHCDDPVCLKGCPTRAYTKHAEYGAVLQDPDTCFGCGYCTWVCPYNAPQLDPVKGQVSKCNMCVDRLEVGLKPACVSACIGNALDFGVIEKTPENREQCKTHIPGFPDPDITHPNIRFQQIKTLPDEMTRTDSTPIKYHKDKQGNYQAIVDKNKVDKNKIDGSNINEKTGKTKNWNIAKLNSRENPLVLFTLFAQAAIGTFFIPFIAALFGIDTFTNFIHSDMFLPLTIVSLVMVSFALLMSVTHLGKPKRFYRGFNNLRYSPMAREGFGLAMFSLGTALTALFALPSNKTLTALLNDFIGLNIAEITAYLPANLSANSLMIGTGIFAVIAGSAGLYYMNKCYQIKARPFWHHLQTATSFIGNSLSLGAFVAAVIVLTTLVAQDKDITEALTVFTLVFVAGLLLEAAGLIKHNHDLSRSENEGGAAHYVQCTTFGKTYLLRNIALALNITATLLLISITALDLVAASSTWLLIAWLVIALVNTCTATIGRALFYILVIPTTMPGAFFWKNKSFEQHARDTGLADNPATGVAPLAH